MRYSEGFIASLMELSTAPLVAFSTRDYRIIVSNSVFVDLFKNTDIKKITQIIEKTFIKELVANGELENPVVKYKGERYSFKKVKILNFEGSVVLAKFLIEYSEINYDHLIETLLNSIESVGKEQNSLLDEAEKNIDANDPEKLIQKPLKTSETAYYANETDDIKTETMNLENQTYIRFVKQNTYSRDDFNLSLEKQQNVLDSIISEYGKNKVKELINSFDTQDMMNGILIDLFEELLIAGSVDINRVLSDISRIIDAPRSFMLIVSENEGKYIIDRHYHWANQGEDQSYIDLKGKELNEVSPDILAMFLNNEIISFNINKESNQMMIFLDSLNIKSILMAPVKVNINLWGFIGVACDTEIRKWTKKEISFLQIIASIQGISIELQKYRSRYLNYANLSDEVLWKLDKEHNFDFVSSAVVVITGYKPEELIGEKFDKLGFKFHFDSLVSGEIVRGVETEVVRKDGSKRWLNNSFVAMGAHAGAMEIYGSSVDITDLKMLSEMHKETKGALDRSNYLFTKAAELANSFVSGTIEAFNIRQDFISEMSNDLKSPMNSIMGMLYLLLNTKLDTNQLNYMNLMERSAKDLLNKMDEIFDYLKIENKDLNFEEIDFKLENIILGVLNPARARASEKNIELKLDMDSNLPEYVYGEPLFLFKILANIINNAVKYTSKGEITVSVKLEGKVDDEIIVFFSIKDTGRGMSKEQQRKIFTALKQQHSLVLRKYEGLGLGFSLAKSFVELMKGNLWLKSEEGKGTVVYFNIRLSKSEIISKHKYNKFSNLKVLIIDSKFQSRRNTREIVNSMGFGIIRTADNVGMALNTMNELKEMQMEYDLILIDENLPDLSVGKAIKHIKRISPFAQVVIMASAVNKYTVKSYYKDADDIILHPITKNVLRDCVIDIFSIAEKSSLLKIDENKNSPFRGIRVLLAEKEPSDLKDLLYINGCIVAFAYSGIDVIDMLYMGEFDMVFIDISLPELDGIETAKQIRQNKKFSRIPIVGMADEDSIAKEKPSYSTTVFDMLMYKPLGQKSLMDIISKHITVGAGSFMNIEYEMEDILFPGSIDGINIDDGLKRVAGNKELYFIILLKIKDDLPSIWAELESEHLKGNKDTVMNILHGLNELLKNISAEEAHSKGITLEASFNKTSYDMKMFDAFKESIQKLMDGLKLI